MGSKSNSRGKTRGDAARGVQKRQCSKRGSKEATQQVGTKEATQQETLGLGCLTEMYCGCWTIVGLAKEGHVTPATKTNEMQ